MRFSTRLKVVCVLTGLVWLFAGCAWGDETSVKQAVTDYNTSNSTSLTAEALGSTVTIAGTANNVTSTLKLGDISGLTIVWEATLTATLTESTNEWMGDAGDRNLILIKAQANNGDGEFIVSGGKIALLDPFAKDRDPDTTYQYQSSNRSAWPRMINLPDVEVVVEDGEIELTTAHGSAFTNRDGNGGTIEINGGTISVPYGEITGDYSINDVTLGLDAASGLTGVYSYEAGSRYCSFVYNDVTMLTKDGSQGDGEGQLDMVIEQGGILTFTYPVTGHFGTDCVTTVKSGGVLVVEEGAVYTLDGNLIVEPGGRLVIRGTLIVTGIVIIKGGTIHTQETADANNGVLNIYGTLINLNEITNDGTINNFSGNTLDNQEKLTNNGAIYNHAKGKITNIGDIENNGTIDNTAGGTFESVQTASEMGGAINGGVKPIGPDSPSSGGGCNTGFGLFGLLLPVAFVIHKKYLTA
jgi:Synergist-CTERM protein sorting domain-containing protein